MRINHLYSNAVYALMLKDNSEIKLERPKRTSAALLTSLRPPLCVDETLDTMFGEHYFPVHQKAALLGGMNCKIRDFEFPKKRNLGSGGYGVVKEGLHKPTNQTFAVKSIIEMNPDWHKWIRAEECTQYGLDFPFITKLYCTMVYDWYAWLVLELVEGQTLKKMLQNEKMLGIVDPRKIVAQLIVSLEYLHLNNVVIGDLTTANVMIAKKGDIKIIDFGFALRHNPLEDDRPPSWEERRPLPDFTNNPYIDWYSLGMLIFEMMAAVRPGIECPPLNEDLELEEEERYSKFGVPPTVRHSNCRWLGHSKLKLDKCEQLLDQVSCDLISHFMVYKDADNWKSTWGLTKESRQLIREHPWFNGFDWTELDSLVESKMILNTYNS